VSVGTVQKSMAQETSRWLRRNGSHVVEGCRARASACARWWLRAVVAMVDDIPVAPNSTVTSFMDITDLFDLSKPGRYTLQGIYADRPDNNQKIQNGWSAKLTSNVQAFEIKAPSGR